MPIAAVPKYLGRNFKNASPALRFGMLLPLWGVNRRTKELLWTTSDISHEVRGPLRQEREIKLNNKVDALAQAEHRFHSRYNLLPRPLCCEANVYCHRRKALFLQ